MNSKTTRHDATFYEFSKGFTRLYERNIVFLQPQVEF